MNHCHAILRQPDETLCEIAESHQGKERQSQIENGEHKIDCKFAKFGQLGNEDLIAIFLSKRKARIRPMNLTQLLMTRENVDRISQQFGLSEQQTVDAMQSLIPAFSEGLKRQTATRQGTAGLIQALASGGHVRYVDNPDLAMQPAGIVEGNAILGHLFGNKEVSRAVSERASAASGLSGSLLKSLLPVIAPMVLGAIFKGSTGNRGGGVGGALGNALSGAAGGGLLGTILEGLVGGAASGAPQTRRRRRGGGGLEDLLGQVLGGSQQRPTRRRSRQNSPAAPRRRRQTGGGGLGDLLGDLLGGGAQRSSPRKQARYRDPVMPPPSRRRRAQPQRRIEPEDVFGDMLEPGGNISRQYRRETSDVFDQLLGG